MRIIGIDPGTRIAGYGIIDVNSKGRPVAVAAGAWCLEIQQDEQKKYPLPARLGTLVLELRRVLEVYKPTHLCLEQSFVADNPKTAMYLGHARGVILAEAYLNAMIISEISATSAKKAIAGHGRAAKQSVARVMSQLLGFSLEKLPLDATDALAIAYADALRLRSLSIAK